VHHVPPRACHPTSSDRSTRVRVPGRVVRGGRAVVFAEAGARTITRAHHNQRAHRHPLRRTRALGAFADERRIVSGDEGGSEMLNTLPSGSAAPPCATRTARGSRRSIQFARLERKRMAPASHQRAHRHLPLRCDRSSWSRVAVRKEDSVRIVDYTKIFPIFTHYQVDGCRIKT
jgi:hypothetical protein